MSERTRLVLIRLPDVCAELAVCMEALEPLIDQPADKIRYLNCQLRLGKILAEALLTGEFECGTPS